MRYRYIKRSLVFTSDFFALLIKISLSSFIKKYIDNKKEKKALNDRVFGLAFSKWKLPSKGKFSKSPVETVRKVC